MTILGHAVLCLVLKSRRHCVSEHRRINNGVVKALHSGGSLAHPNDSQQPLMSPFVEETILKLRNTGQQIQDFGTLIYANLH